MLLNFREDYGISTCSQGLRLRMIVHEYLSISLRVRSSIWNCIYLYMYLAAILFVCISMHLAKSLHVIIVLVLLKILETATRTN